MEDVEAENLPAFCVLRDGAEGLPCKKRRSGLAVQKLCLGKRGAVLHDFVPDGVHGVEIGFFVGAYLYLHVFLFLSYP